MVLFRPQPATSALCGYLGTVCATRFPKYPSKQASLVSYELTRPSFRPICDTFAVPLVSHTAQQNASSWHEREGFFPRPLRKLIKPAVIPRLNSKLS